MLVHDCANDLYLIEREYRIGCDAFAYGLPAGLIDGGEDVEEAALRELREETGVEPAGRDGVEFDHVGQFYSSEGMTDELANIMVLHLHAWASRSNVISTAMSTSNRRGSPGSGCAAPVLRPPIP